VPEPERRLAGEARVIAEADAIVASTGEERDFLIDLYAAHPERIRLVPPGVDHDVFRPADRELAKDALGLGGKQVLLFVGRLQPLKGADTALRATAHLVEWGRLHPGAARLLVVGGPSGPAGEAERRRLEALARSLGLSELVSFVPAQPHRSLPRYYQAADVCLVPSHSESFGLVALEAQACGIPVVGSAVGGLKAVVRHGRTGFLLPPGAAEAFAERAWRILSDPALAGAMSGLAVCSSHEFSWARCGGELHDLYIASRQNSQEEMTIS
jgi:D-inositol-3-phosphate glycosyltransferase